jgi:hypothetical protein
MGAEHSRFEGNGLTPKQEIRQYIQTIRSRPTNTMEQWNLMIDAERVLERAELDPWDAMNAAAPAIFAVMGFGAGPSSPPEKKAAPLFPGSDEWAIPDHNGGWGPPLG